MNEAMKQSLSEKAVEILTQIQGAVASGAKLGAEQLPDIAQQFVQYTIVTSIVSIIVGLGLVGLANKWGKKSYVLLHDEDNGIGVPLGFGALTAGVFGFIFTISSIEPLLLALTAPKILIIKELLSVIK